MHYFATADTDIGNTKSTNQDSLLIKHASYCGGEVMLAVICDGMGGLSKGELASATVIKEFSKWFDEELPYEIEKLDMNVIGEKWSLLLKELNIRIIEYGQLNHISLGTTFTGILMVNDKYVIGHVGDTRVYFIGNGMMQLTEDQTFVAKNIVNRYTSAMSELLNGSEYNNASNGLSAAIERINAQIRSLSGKVQSNYNAINQYNRNVDYWNRKLSDLRKKNKVKKK